MIRASLFLFFCFICHTLSASHMVGGGFRYTYISNNKYLIQLDYHKDCSANAVDYPPGAIRIGIYKKTDNTLVQSLDLTPGPIILVNAITDSCVNAAVTCVQKRVYSDTLFLNNATFNDSTGYYLSYEQCCRNFGIKNIRDPDKSGIAFYAEFMPFTSQNTSFTNSSPYLAEEQSVYLCVMENFVADYKHIDPDGDSLVYKLIDPLMGTTDPVFNNANGISVLNPKPYPAVDWSSGYGFTASNIMDGQPDLSMNLNNGLLLITPTQIGMYSFAYVVEEYRSGKLIAVYNREVQYYVVLCAARDKPNVSWLNSSENMVQADSTICLRFKANDVNASDSLSFYIRQFTGVLAQQAFTTEVEMLSSNELYIKVCIDVSCALSQSTVDSFMMVVRDNSCPFNLSDTLIVHLNLLRKLNNTPSISWLNPTDNKLKVNAETCVNIIAQDADLQDRLKLYLGNFTNDLADIKYTVDVDSTIKSNVIARICFYPDCNLSNNSNEQFMVYVNDGACPANLFDSLSIGLTTENPGFENPLEEIPNAFSPNSDGKNDYFKIHNNIKASCVDEFNILIYNRWGEKVYESNNFEFEWSGGGLPAGVYFYVMKLGNREKLGHLSIIY